MSDWNISFIKAMLKISSFWRGFSQSTKLDNRHATEEKNSRGHSFPSSLLCHVTSAICQILIHSDAQMSSIFEKLCDPVVMTLLVPGEECHLDFSPKSCAYPTLVTLDPLEAEIISVLLCKNNCPKLFCSFTIDNSSYITTVRKKCFVYPCFQ